MSKPSLLKRSLNENYKGRFSVMDAHVENASEQKAKLVEDGLYRLFEARHGLKSLAEIQEFAKTHICEWHINRDDVDPIIERFRIDDDYVAEFRMEWVKSHISVSCRMTWVPYTYPIKVEGCDLWD